MTDEQTPVPPNERYIVSLDMYEGPLDLLLELIRKHELDILNIPIAFITEKYLEYLDLMKGININLASEYLEMAAKLIYIKSRMMLPEENMDLTDELDGDDGPDPREDLIRQLLEYQKYKTAAKQLFDLHQQGRDTFVKGSCETVDKDEQGIASPGLFSLMQALQTVFDRLKDSNETISEISITRISISTRIQQVLEALRSRKRMPFLDLFKGSATRTDVVVTFLALLEMSKLGLTILHQAAPGTEIHVKITESEIDAEKLLEDYKLEDNE